MAHANEKTPGAEGRLAGKIALVTGGSTGYGKGIARCLIQAGVTVWITGRHEQRLASAASEIGAKYVVADVTSTADWDRVLKTIVSDTGRIDILVNNAGGAIRIAPIVEQTDDAIAAVIALNLLGPMYGCRRAASVMGQQRDGVIINISSVCSQHAWPGWAPYSAAKAGMDMFSRALHTEVRSQGIRVTTVIPSWGDTEFNKAAGIASPAAESPERKVMSPDELGEIVLTVCRQPRHLVMPIVAVQPMIQEIIPM